MFSLFPETCRRCSKKIKYDPYMRTGSCDRCGIKYKMRIKSADIINCQVNSAMKEGTILEIVMGMGMFSLMIGFLFSPLSDEERNGMAICCLIAFLIYVPHSVYQLLKFDQLKKLIASGAVKTTKQEEIAISTFEREKRFDEKHVRRKKILFYTIMVVYSILMLLLTVALLTGWTLAK